MARFCTKCGSPVTEGMAFCTSCGNPVGAAPSPPAPAPQAAPPAPQPPPPPPPVPIAPAVPVAEVPIAAAPAAVASGAVAAPAKGSPVLKIVLIVLGVIVLLSILGIGSCAYMLWKAKNKGTAMLEQARTTMSHPATPEVQAQPQGGAGAEAENPATKDVPPYPGSQATEAGGDLSMGGMGGMSGQEFVTPDPIDKVIQFYKDKFGSTINVQQSEGSAMFQLTTSNGLTTVTITRDEGAGKTKINIARIGK